MAEAWSLRQLLAELEDAPTQRIIEQEHIPGDDIENHRDGSQTLPWAYHNARAREATIKSLNAIILTLWLQNAVDNAHDMGKEDSLDTYGLDEYGMADLCRRFEQEDTVMRYILNLAQIGAGHLVEQGKRPDLALLDGNELQGMIEILSDAYREAR